MADAAAVEPGVTYGDLADGSARRLVLAPGVEHIGVLYGQGGIGAALDWLNQAFGHRGDGFIDARGRALGLLFLGIVALAWPLSRLLPRAATRPLGAGLGWRRLLPVALLPAVLTPLILRFLPSDYLPDPARGLSGPALRGLRAADPGGARVSVRRRDPGAVPGAGGRAGAGPVAGPGDRHPGECRLPDPGDRAPAGPLRDRLPARRRSASGWSWASCPAPGPISPRTAGSPTARDRRGPRRC